MLFWIPGVIFALLFVTLCHLADASPGTVTVVNIQAPGQKIPSGDTAMYNMAKYQEQEKMKQKNAVPKQSFWTEALNFRKEETVVAPLQQVAYGGQQQQGVTIPQPQTMSFTPQQQMMYAGHQNATPQPQMIPTTPVQQMKYVGQPSPLTTPQPHVIPTIPQRQVQFGTSPNASPQPQVICTTPQPQVAQASPYAIAQQQMIATTPQQQQLATPQQQFLEPTAPSIPQPTPPRPTPIRLPTQRS